MLVECVFAKIKLSLARHRWVKHHIEKFLKELKFGLSFVARVSEFRGTQGERPAVCAICIIDAVAVLVHHSSPLKLLYMLLQMKKKSNFILSEDDIWAMRRS